MRTKTEARRQAILETAAETFRERGFEATSMSEVAARLGGSKATLYNYFGSKEELFFEVMHCGVREQADPIIEQFCATASIVDAVRSSAPQYVRLMLRPEVMAITRMCVAEGERSGFGPAIYEQGPKPKWERLSARIARAMDEGELRPADPMRATLHLLALCEAGPVSFRLRGWAGPPTEAEIEATANEAAEAFLRAYAPDPA